MSNMSELSISAATTRNEGPDSMDVLAHELAHMTLAYITDKVTYSELYDASTRFSDAVFVIEESSSRHVRPERLADILATEFAFLESITEGRDYNKCRDKLNEWQRARRGLGILGYKFYKGDEVQT